MFSMLSGTINCFKFKLDHVNEHDLGNVVYKNLGVEHGSVVVSTLDLRSKGQWFWACMVP